MRAAPLGTCVKKTWVEVEITPGSSAFHTLSTARIRKGGESMDERTTRSERLDLSDAVVVVLGDDRRVAKAAEMLIDEAEKRTQIRWRIAADPPATTGASAPTLVIGTAEAVAAADAGSEHPSPAEWPSEGYRIEARPDAAPPTVSVTGSDARGVLFGVGRLLRALRMTKGRITLSSSFAVRSAPRYLIRGHQLGYRPKTNSYDAWSLSMWEQYIRDLAVFGANAIELIPPRSDDDADSPHFPLPPMETMIGMSRILDEYGLDVWIWQPAMDSNYGDPQTVEFALSEWGETFRQLSRVDAVFVPGGDPGHTPPDLLMALLERQSEILSRYHPRARIWVSPQGFTQAWLDEFLRILNEERPEWLGGVVYGPQVRISLKDLRARVPQRYPIRNYPDITHTRQCQYAVPNWDAAFAFTEGREPINPRPLDQVRLFRIMGEDAAGFITYSEGCNDDANKAVWSALGWDPGADVTEILREYGRYYVADGFADDIAQGLLALERNWRGALLTNEGVSVALQQWRAVERAASPQVKLNWRFQQPLYRAYYDAYLRSRLIYETALEDRAMERLRDARRIGSLLALSEAEAVLDLALTQPVGADWRARIFELAEALYQSIRMQLSVERYAAIAVERGANLDSVDVPLNNRAWLKARFDEIRAMSAEEERQRGVEAILNWTDPGPGGFYVNLGRPSGNSPPRPEEDLSALASSRVGFAYPSGGRISWRYFKESLYDRPLELRFSGLDPTARYRLRVTYGGDNSRARIRLTAGEGIEIHPFRDKEKPIRPAEFDLPPEATRSGELALKWEGEPGRGGNGRGCQASEVWLVKARENED
jgi:hypothetical protein